MEELNLYHCHKRVRAGLITGISPLNTDGSAELYIFESGKVYPVDAAWLARNPKLAVGGYFVVYVDNQDQYTSYSPAEPFESGYTLSGNMNFGGAIEAMKQGSKVARKGWNGKGIFIQIQFPDEHSKMTSPYIYINTTGLQTDNPDAPKSLVPWLASQTDMLAEDWEIV